MSGPINTAYFTNLNSQVSGAKSCAELQEIATAAVNALNDLTASITAQTDIVAPQLALLTPPTNPTAVVTWAQSLITDYLTPQLASYTSYIAQLAAIATEAATLIAAITAAASALGSCSITIPTFVPGSIPGPPTPPVYPPYASGITVSDGITTLTDIDDFIFSGAVVTSGGTGVADISVTGGGGGSLSITDGSHTVAAVTSLTVVGGVVSGATPNATITVSGGSGTVTSVGISTPGAGVVVGGGPITTTGTLTVDLSSTAYAALALAVSALQSISIATGTGLTGGPLTASGTTVALANTAVTAGSYTTANITVDAQGRITAASSGSAAIGVPGTIPDLTLWWESDNILGASGTLISRLQERTPWIGGLAAAAPSSPGAGVAIDSTLLNGFSVLKWPAASTAGQYAIPYPVGTSAVGASGIVFSAGATYFIVSKGSTATGTQAITGGPTGALSLYLVSTGGTAKIGLVKTGVSVIGASTTAWTAGTAFQANVTYNPTTGAFAFRQGRATAGSGTGTAAAGGAGQPTNLLGGDVGNTSLLNAASLAVLICYNRVLSGTEITNVENYINAKWGV